MTRDSCTRRLMSLAEDVIASLARSTDRTLADNCCAVAATASESLWVASAVAVRLPVAPSSSPADDDTTSTTWPISIANSSASLFISALRSATALSCASLRSADTRSSAFSLKTSEGPGHLANLIATSGIGNLHGCVALRQTPHDMRDLANRPGHTPLRDNKA